MIKGVKSSGILLALSLVFVVASFAVFHFGAGFSADNKLRHGSEVIASWYGRNGANTNVASVWSAKDQLAAIGQYTKQLLGSVGVTISPAEVDVYLEPGLRREQVAEILAPRLNWDDEEKEYFARLEPMCYVDRPEGRFFPGHYTFVTYLSPAEVEAIMDYEFDNRMASLLQDPNPDDPVVASALKIASLLQREAAGDGDERVIAGIIWNRIFADMPLQLDATLQYVKGEPGNWWPVPVPADKFIESPFNTYLNKGLPPTPIASPNMQMIAAALNPEPTDCYYYIHARRNFYCTPDYEGHIRNIRRYL